MRTEEKWSQFRKNYLSKFPPRLQEDLERFPPIKKIPVPVQSTYIFGSVETGKTIRAAHMMLAELKYIYLNEIPNVHNKTFFVNFPVFLQQIKQTYNKQGESEREVLEKYTQAHLLVLDDFLTVRPTDWAIDILYYLINYRYEYKKKTIITSNYSLKEAEDILQDQRITSRINRICKIEEKELS
jgi:DNA replication protein DnaC